MRVQAVAFVTVSLLSSIGAVPASRSSSPLLLGRQVPSKQCSHITGGVHVIATPGEGFAAPPYGLIGSLTKKILKAIPGSTNVSVPYNHSNPNGLQQTQDGVCLFPLFLSSPQLMPSFQSVTLRQYIKDYHTYCPNTKIVLVGYSSGSIMTLNVLCGESAPYNPAMVPLSYNGYGPWSPSLSLPFPPWPQLISHPVIAAVIYGDESRTNGTSYDHGTCTGVGAHPRANATGCDPWADKIRSYCDKDDPFCCKTTGTNNATHYVYPGEYDDAATSFVLRKFKAAGGA